VLWVVRSVLVCFGYNTVVTVHKKTLELATSKVRPIFTIVQEKEATDPNYRMC